MLIGVHHRKFYAIYQLEIILLNKYWLFVSLYSSLDSHFVRLIRAFLFIWFCALVSVLILASLFFFQFITLHILTVNSLDTLEVGENAIQSSALINTNCMFIHEPNELLKIYTGLWTRKLYVHISMDLISIVCELLLIRAEEVFSLDFCAENHWA